MDREGSGGVSLEARCQLHQGQPFTAVCARCGTYMCEVCSERGKFEACPACRRHTGTGAFPFRRDHFTLRELLSFSFARYKKNWAVLSIGLVITGVVVGLVNAAGLIVQLIDPTNIGLIMAAQFVLLVPQVVSQTWLTLGLLLIAVRIARDEPVELSMLFAEWRKIGGMLVQSMLINVLVLAALLAMAIPLGAAYFLGDKNLTLLIGLAAVVAPPALFAISYVVLGLYFCSMEYVAQPRVGAIEAMKNSWEIARGQRFTLFAALCIALALLFGGIILCLVGAIFTGGIALMLYASLYLALRNGAEGLSA